MSTQQAPPLGSVFAPRWAGGIPWILAGLTILAQITWVLATGAARDALTIGSVALFFCASGSHALLTRGPRWTTVFFGVALSFGFAIEAIGVAAGVPFGAYEYGDRLGPSVLSVPLLIPLAWAMMAYPCYVVAERAIRSRAGAVVLAGTLIATWDLFLDPQMVAEGHWTFADSSLALPGSTGTPIVNHAGWFAAGLALMTLAWCALSVSGSARSRPQDGEAADIVLPAVLLVWVYCSNVLANAVFLDRPLVALVGGIGMGIPMAVALVGLRRKAVAGAQ